ncbi:abortive phage infection protein [Streptomyces albipurpureus]|uniref:Abortive phage infection protein n=1 Tax=Streptomyces albipurpureus TaxID=2897419 RepID=A0ABT0UMF1_9ACTN|nr:abortive phage infection protein [Streptomyces sp. CWNU-1]MCM2389788.1 abortive phage infection protein [Streptomyces sp. CWNU-1]
MGVATAVGTTGWATAAEPTPIGTSDGNARRRGLTHRGVCYTLGAGETPGTAWQPARVRDDVRAIQRELHADSIKVTGDGVQRLTTTAAEAAERGLHIWLEPTLGDQPEQDILDHLAECGRFAERLRRQGAKVDLSVGCEFWLFVPGIVPGAHVLERIANLQNGTFDPVHMQRELRRFIGRAARVGRSVFHGRLSYASAQGDEVDWTLFDIVGLNYYSSFPRRSSYVRELEKYLRWGKPLAITEFGTCTFVGAPEAGGMGWATVDYTKDPPEIIGNPIRSEHTQAVYLLELLDVFESMGLYSAMAFEFITPDQPHRKEIRYDLDLASYGIVKVIKDNPNDPESDWHWKPKESFHALARRYARAATD